MTSSSDRRPLHGAPEGGGAAAGRGPSPAAAGPAAAGKPMYARFIPREELDSFSAWTPGALGAGEAPGGPPGSADAQARAAEQAQRDAELQRQQTLAARQAGYQEGYRDGLVALEGFKQHYAAQVTGQVVAIANSYGARLDELEQHLAERITGIVLELARQALRAELQLRPQHIVAVADEALGTLLNSARHVTLRLHPDDQALVMHGCAEALAARHARVVADASLARGGCLVESDIGVVDAQVATRWARAAQSFGDPGGWAGGDTPAGAP